MRKYAVSKTKKMSVKAVAGTHVITLGIDLAQAKATGLLGFSIQRTDHAKLEANPNAGPDWLEGLKVFEALEPEKAPGRTVSTEIHPIQDFFWSDFTVRPGQKYTYRIIARKALPGALEDIDEVSVAIQTEKVDTDKEHTVFFNRGVAGSQAFVRKFGTDKFEKIATEKIWVWDWLSRGLWEALRDFVREAKNSSFGIRAAIYEFQYEPLLNELANAGRRGADVRVVYDAMVDETDKTKEKNETAIKNTGIKKLCKPRTRCGDIPHNKFIILLKNNQPIAVWTGSTNITTGGIFGHSNVGHLVRNPQIAQKYLNYWEALSKDLPLDQMQARTVAITPDPPPQFMPPNGGADVYFSPRPEVRLLEWFSELFSQSEKPVFITCPFGLDKRFEKGMKNGKKVLKYVITDKKDSGLQGDDVRGNAFNKIAHGAMLGKNINHFEGWLKERLTGLNKVYYLHTKYLLVDPLGVAPLVVSGSANFSENSVDNNDENMLVIRGDRRTAEIYFGEFMRLFRHFYFRSVESDFDSGENRSRMFLHTDDAWAREYYNPESPKCAERLYFSSK